MQNPSFAIYKACKAKKYAKQLGNAGRGRAARRVPGTVTCENGIDFQPRTKYRNPTSPTIRRQRKLIRKAEFVDKPERPRQMPLCERRNRPLGAGQIIDPRPTNLGTTHSYNQALMHSSFFAGLMGD